MIYTTYKFQPVRQVMDIKVTCPECKKSRKKRLTRVYYRNGFHDESETSKKNLQSMEIEAERLRTEGLICSKCDEIKRGAPVVTKDGDKYKVALREDPTTIIGTVRKDPRSWGWIYESEFVEPCKWNIPTKFEAISILAERYKAHQQEVA